MACEQHFDAQVVRGEDPATTLSFLYRAYCRVLQLIRHIGRHRGSPGAQQRRARRAGDPAQGSEGATPGQRHPPGGSKFLRGEARPPTDQVVTFIDTHRDRESGGCRWGVEPICAALQVAPSTYDEAKDRPPSARARRDALITPLLVALWVHNYSVHGRLELWVAARRAGIDIGRDPVARLMAAEGISGASRATKHFTTKADPAGPRPPRCGRCASPR